MQETQSATPNWFAETLGALLARRELTEPQIRTALTAMMNGTCGEAETTALLVALRMKGESSGEIAAGARLLREHMIRWDAGTQAVLDTCGTGGDGLGTFNISTATAFVVAAAGVSVVKHGNRAVSSRSGSTDVLTALGITPATDPETARRSLQKCGLAFCSAPSFHPALKQLGPLRKRLGVGTLFNWLGPLANPAGAAHQLLGVGRPELLDLMAGALAKLGTRRAFIVCSRDGLDEVSLSAPTLVREVCGNVVRAWEWTPADFGLEPCSLAELQADGPEASAAMIRAVLLRQLGAGSRIVLANAAAALMAAERVATLLEGIALASDAIRSGRALSVLDALAND
ncbi:MAG TPA: anthranilate phosphoribosyltransferase [Gemmataceae bacterium]|nr:anthranilate phosphoribosyltransferase [Gemmataceae bacterium]